MDHDKSYKLLFSHAEMVEDLLRGFVREDWVADLDFATLERAGNSYVSDDLRERMDDIVWRLRFRDEWLYVYVLIEFQSSVDVYLLIDEGAYADSELAELRNLAAALFRLENSRTPKDVERVLEALVEWLKMPGQASLRRAFTLWLKRVFLKGRMPGVDFEELNELNEVKSMLAERVVEWTEEWQKQGEARGEAIGEAIGEARGEARGLEKGRQEGEAALLQRLLDRRFGPLDEALRQRIAEADADTLLRWGERIFQAATAEDVLRG